MQVQDEPIIAEGPARGLPRSADTTPLTELFPGLLAKFESHNPGGSHKVRAARHIVRRGLESGHIVPGETTIIEKTGGNFGFGLTVACSEIGVPVEVAVGLGFSPIKRQCLDFFGAKLIGIEMLNKGAKPREVVEWHLANADALGKTYFYTDQFNNIGSLEAHLHETGPEIATQLRADFPNVTRLTFVACAGTGASLTGIAKALRAADYDVEVVLVEPEGCDSKAGVFRDHQLEGMSVGVTPPFLNWTLISEIEYVSFAKAVDMQRMLSASRGFFVGNTSAACLHVAMKRCEHFPDSYKILTVVYDHGFWYLNSIFGNKSVC